MPLSYLRQILTKQWRVERKPSVFRPHKAAYEDKIIDYPGSSTGRAYIGLSKAPLMPTDTGIGFMGVLLQNEDRSLVQCSGCGNWMQQINYKHIRKCLG